MEEEDKIPLDRNERLKLFWYAPEFEQARRFAGDPEEYSYDDITDEDLDHARVPKYQGEPLPLPEKEPPALEYLLSTLGMGGEAVDVDDRPEQETNNYLQVAGPIEPVDPLLNAHRSVKWNLRENGRRSAVDPENHMHECLYVAGVLDLYRSMTSSEKVVRLALPSTPVPGRESEAILSLLMQLHLRGWKAEVTSEVRLPDEQDKSFGLRIGIDVTANGPLRAEFYDGAVDSHEKILNKNLETVEDYDRYWLLSMRYSTRYIHVQAACELVGHLSEGLDYISYNEAGIRDSWIKGRLNEEVQWDKKNDPIKYQRFIDLLGTEVREDDDYDAALTSLIAKIEGWPAKYSNNPYDLDELTIEERLKVLPLQLATEGSLQRALNHYCDLTVELEKHRPSN